MANTLIFIQQDPALYRRASALALITIFYNIAEGLVSVLFGLGDESFALFGFGLDSFVEVISGVGIWHMVRRLRRNGGEDPDPFERRALRITGSAFFVLTAGLAVTAVVNLVQGHRPETAFWGIVISIVSIVTMGVLIRLKVAVGRALNSPAILADAACTRTCLQLSVVLLLASAGYELTGLGGLDAVGTMVIAAMSYREGREAFEKARTGSFACACGGACGAEGQTREQGQTGSGQGECV
jgi:divalent metal cation (Fe/Co/Zn/Cd) transporter